MFSILQQGFECGFLLEQGGSGARDAGQSIRFGFRLFSGHICYFCPGSQAIVCFRSCARCKPAKFQEMCGVGNEIQHPPPQFRVIR